ncbi:MAG TPA: alpha-L-arabinofuranosidase C-terminal domain-containing protein, partial [Kribbella sp.]|nr:alpha-L-arabinofuranosidase C-terminal domain-containing protein [Kribbella sp.]
RHSERLVMANIAQTVNVLQAMLLTDEDGGMVRTPTYHVFEMNKGHHDASALPVHVVEGRTYDLDGTAMQLVSASASVKDGQALVSLSNLDPSSALDVVLDLRGASSWESSGRLLTASKPQAYNTVGDPDAVAPVPLAVEPEPRGLKVTLPPHSFATVSLVL